MTPPEDGGCNHKGATKYEFQIDAYIRKELGLGTMIGLFENIPFKGPVAISPLSTRPKHDSDTRRVIMDCSWPIGVSLNDGIDKNQYLDKTVDLKYPTIDMVCRYIVKLANKNKSESIWLFKEDLDRAFRQLYCDFRSIPLLGFRWKNRYYFDVVMMMGCHIAPYVCQRTMDMIAHLHEKMSYTVFNYVDDCLGVEYKSVIEQAHKSFLRLLKDIGVARSEKKAIEPTQELEFVGNLLNTEFMTLGVTPSRKQEILQELEIW